MSDAWDEIQAIKSKRNSLRERLEKRKKERQDILGASSANSTVLSPSSISSIAPSLKKEDSKTGLNEIFTTLDNGKKTYYPWNKIAIELTTISLFIKNLIQRSSGYYYKFSQIVRCCYQSIQLS